AFNILDAVDVDSEQAVAPFDALSNFVGDVSSAGGFLADEHTGDSRSFKSLVNQSLHGSGAFLFCFFPKRCVLKTSGCGSQNDTALADNIDAKYVVLVVEAKKDTACHDLYDSKKRLKINLNIGAGTFGLNTTFLSDVGKGA